MLLRRICLVSVLALACLFPARPGTAAPQILGNYWAETVGCDTTGGTCLTQFSAIAIGKKLVVTDATCTIKQSVSTAYVSAVAIYSAAGIYNYFAPDKTGFFGLYTNYVLSAKPNLLILPGQRPFLQVQVTGSTTSRIISNCTLSGTYSNFP